MGKFMLMNSFSTNDDTMEFLRSKYPDLAAEGGLEMLQNKVPKLDADTFVPATSATDPSNEWCPPGHGDLYAALVGSGRLAALLKDGYKYMFVSNSDNLGATLDLGILTHFAVTGASFMMECCERTENDKTVDPKDGTSQKVVQLETAMGAAIECFDGASAVVVPRSRFAPVKKCNDLLLLRSDAYIITEDFRPVLNPACGGVAPVISLDSKKYKLVGSLEEATSEGVPSLVECKRLTIKGMVRLGRSTRFVGSVSITNTSSESKYVCGKIEDATLDVSAVDGLGALKPTVATSAPISDQKPGTSGLRKK